MVKNMTEHSKFSIVVPTMWKYAPFVNFLKDLVQFDMVGEIIIINNAIQETPDDTILSHPKIALYNCTKNIGVNPAWNLGVNYSKFEKICILNDDIQFDLKVFFHVEKYLNEQTGVIGICPGIAEFNQPPVTTGSISIIPWTGQHTFGFGCLMFVHKSWYCPIPTECKIYYGDNWIFDTCLVRGQTNYLITDALMMTPYASTTSTVEAVNELLQVEGAVYRAKLAEYRQN